MNYICKISSPIGLLSASSDGENIIGLWIEGQKYFKGTLTKLELEQEIPVFGQLRKWLTIYFSGREPDFFLPLAPAGSDFRRAVWKILCEIPYGKVTTYGNIARQMEKSTGKRQSAQAVGGAVGHNPISILIPCHRVIGADGSLTGYAGGVEKKAQLLQIEAYLPN